MIVINRLRTLSSASLIIWVRIRRRDFEKALNLRKLKEEIVDRLGNIAAQLKLVQEEEVVTNGGRIDIVWYYTFKLDTPYLGPKLPIVGFEIETSWRTRKRIKGDIFNLLELSPALGVILFLSKGFRDDSQLRGNVDAAKRYVSSFSGFSRILIWTDRDVEKKSTKSFFQNDSNGSGMFKTAFFLLGKPKN